jgi:transcriptional regulator with XRE-family HTH domain
MRNVYSSEYKEFLKRLKKARLDAGFTQAEVALRLKKPQSYVSKTESGERRLDIIEVFHLGKIYKKSMTYFVSTE